MEKRLRKEEEEPTLNYEADNVVKLHLDQAAAHVTPRRFAHAVSPLLTKLETPSHPPYT
jgi:hypothetical protein